MRMLIRVYFKTEDIKLRPRLIDLIIIGIFSKVKDEPITPNHINEVLIFEIRKVAGGDLTRGIKELLEKGSSLLIGNLKVIIDHYHIDTMYKSMRIRYGMRIMNKITFFHIPPMGYIFCIYTTKLGYYIAEFRLDHPNVKLLTTADKNSFNR